MIALQAELESKAEQAAGEGTMKADAEIEAEGEILWDRAAGHVHSAKLEGKARFIMHVQNSFEGPQGSVAFEQKIEFSGTTETVLEVE